MNYLKKFWAWMTTKHVKKVSTQTESSTQSNQGKTMPLSISLSTNAIATLVNKYPELKAAVLKKYLEENVPSLEITGLTTADSVSLSADTASVTVGNTATLDVTLAGDSEITVSSADESIATVSYADGKLTLTGVAAGSVVVTVTKGDASATATVTVSAE